MQIIAGSWAWPEIPQVMRSSCELASSEPYKSLWVANCQPSMLRWTRVGDIIRRTRATWLAVCEETET